MGNATVFLRVLDLIVVIYVYGAQFAKMPTPAVTRTGIVCIFCVAENKGSHQFLNWWQQHATGMLRLDLSIPVGEQKKKTL